MTQQCQGHVVVRPKEKCDKTQAAISRMLDASFNETQSYAINNFPPTMQRTDMHTLDGTRCQEVRQADRPVTTPDWRFYREGLLRSYPEEEFRTIHDRWQFDSSELGTAAMIIDQLWSEIDRLRKEVQ